MTGVKLNAIEKLHPDLKPICEEGRRTLASHSPVPSALLTPTAIGQRLGGHSARAINRILMELGYQVENPNEGMRGHRTEAAYIPTAKGRQYCSLTLATAKNNTSYQHLKWHEDVVEVLRREVEACGLELRTIPQLR